MAPFDAACDVTLIVAGKPKAPLVAMAYERPGVPAKAWVMVGDRPDTDSAGAVHAGVRAILVRTGRLHHRRHVQTADRTRTGMSRIWHTCGMFGVD